MDEFQIQNEQQAHLAAVTGWANRCREHLEMLARAREGTVHFRPSAGGVAMIGLLPSRPQRGRSGFRDLDRLSRDFELLFERHCVDVPQGRPTPEKALQSWMTANAYRHGRRLEALDRAAADAVTTLFVADELALPLGSGKRIVCDLLALRCYPDGRQIPAVIELKSAREMKRLVEQVESYASLIEKNQGAFEALFSAVLGQPVCFSGPAERWIVWPQAGVLSDPRAETLRGQGIRVVGYSQSAQGFAFRVERAL